MAVFGIFFFFIFVYLITGPDATGDTPVYVGDILKYAQTGTAPPTFWDFGHLLWRPLGYLLWRAAGPLTHFLYPDNPVIELTAVLFAVNLVSGAALALLTFSISRRLGLNNLLAFCVTAGILLCDSILNYVHSGCSYVPGVTLQFLAFWLILKGSQGEERRSLYAIGAGIALTLSFAIWFPFCLGVPAALLFAVTGKRGEDGPDSLTFQQIRFAVAIMITIFVAGIGVFAFGAAMAHVSSLDSLQEWVANSGHGVHPERRFLRFPTGVTRTFFFLGDEGVTIKRYLFGDPYAQVGWRDLVSAGLWKVATVFLAFSVLFWSLFKTRMGRTALTVVLTGIVPTLLFALLLFETGQSERYLPFYAALVVGICTALRQRNVHSMIPRRIFALFLLLLAVVNLKAFVGDLRVANKESSQRMRLVHEHTQHGGVALLLSFRDPVSTYFQRSPFDPENRPHALSLYHVIEQERGDVGDWRTQSACRVERAWHEGGEAWISKRLVSTRPQPDWGWVEHDVRALSWSDLIRFFTQLDTDQDIGGTDGFLRLATSPKNEDILGKTCASAETVH